MMDEEDVVEEEWSTIKQTESSSLHSHQQNIVSYEMKCKLTNSFHTVKFKLQQKKRKKMYKYINFQKEKI